MEFFTCSTVGKVRNYSLIVGVNSYLIPSLLIHSASSVDVHVLCMCFKVKSCPVLHFVYKAVSISCNVTVSLHAHK